MMEERIAPKHGYQARMRTSTLRLFGWSWAWVLATALMKFGPKMIWNKSVALTWLAIGLEVAVGVGMIVANKRYLEDLDELQRRVHLNAFGITLGVALVVSLPFTLLDYLGLTSFHAEIWHLLVLMGLTFGGSVIYGSLRYR